MSYVQYNGVYSKTRLKKSIQACIINQSIRKRVYIIFTLGPYVLQVQQKRNFENVYHGSTGTGVYRALSTLLKVGYRYNKKGCVVSVQTSSWSDNNNELFSISDPYQCCVDAGNYKLGDCLCISASASVVSASASANVGSASASASATNTTTTNGFIRKS